MPVIHLSKLELADGYVAVFPLRGDSELVRSEKKYDRHGFGRVIAAQYDNGSWNSELYIKKGDTIIYDDSNAIEVPMVIEEGHLPENVDCIRLSAVYGVERAEGNK